MLCYIRDIYYQKKKKHSELFRLKKKLRKNSVLSGKVRLHVSDFD